MTTKGSDLYQRKDLSNFEEKNNRMNTLVYNLEADKIDQKLLDSIKAFFGNRKVEISVKEEMSLDSLIEKNRDSKTYYEFSSDEFDNFVGKVMNEEQVDYEKFKKIEE